MPAPVSIGTPRTSTPAPLPLDPEFLKKLDRCGYLQARYAAEKHWIDELDKIEKVIQERYKDYPAAEPIHLEGELYVVDLTIREEQQKITDKPKAFAALRKAMGLAALIEALSYTLKLLDAHVPKDKQKSFVEKARTGPRTLRSAIKTAPQAA